MLSANSNTISGRGGFVSKWSPCTNVIDVNKTIFFSWVKSSTPSLFSIYNCLPAIKAPTPRVQFAICWALAVKAALGAMYVCQSLLDSVCILKNTTSSLVHFLVDSISAWVNARLVMRVGGDWCHQCLINCGSNGPKEETNTMDESCKWSLNHNE